MARVKAGANRKLLLKGQPLVKDPPMVKGQPMALVMARARRGAFGSPLGRGA